MRLLRGIGKWFWRFMIIFSFIVNLVLIVVLLLAGIFIFQIKHQVADPLIGGLHSTAAGLGEATIDWTIPVREPALPVNLSVPINAQTITSQITEIDGKPVDPIPGETIVTLTRPVPITIRNAYIQAPALTLSGATVNITLPEGTRLPVSLDMEVAVESTIPVELDVRAVIPLSETQLADPIDTLGLLFEPLAIGLHNLPNNFSEAGSFVSQVLKRDGASWGDHLAALLLATDGTGFNAEAYDAWAGFSRTAGYDYPLLNVPYPAENLPRETGVNVPGGIPALDAALRPEAYDENGNFIPQALGAQAMDNVPDYTWNGHFAEEYNRQQANVGAAVQAVNSNSQSTGETGNSSTTESQSPGILPTPTSP